MKRAIGLCMLAVLVAGAAHAVDFTWAATATTRWNTASAWSPSDRYPGYYSSSPGTAAQQAFGAGDTVTISNGVRINAGGLVYIYVGNFTLTGTTFHYEVTGNHPNLYCLDDNGCNGDWTLGNGAVYYASGNVYVDGNVKTIGNGSISSNTTSTTLTMQGGGKAQSIDYAGATPIGKLIIDTGANVTAGTTDVPSCRDLDVKGTLTGKVLAGAASGTRTITHTGTWTSGELQIKKAGASSTNNVNLGGTSAFPTINTRPAEIATTTATRQNTYQTSNVTADRLWFNKGYSGTSAVRNWIDTWDTMSYDLTLAAR